MRTVFVIQDSGKNLLPAREFGKLQVMLTGKETTEHATLKIEEHLAFMRPDDYLLLIGNPLFIAIASAKAFDQCDGSVNFLLWEREEYRYRIERVELQKAL
jgi:hypothetical protein